MPALLLFPLLLLVPAFWSRRGRWMRWLFWGTAFMVVQWIFLANGISWYGLGMFFGLCVGLEFLAYRSPGVANQSIVAVLIAASLMSNFSHRLWQFDMQRNLFEYAFGKTSGKAMESRTIPYYGIIRDDIAESIRANPERPYIYRIGTFIPYFIPKNLEVLPVADNQLSLFNCIHQERDAAKTTARLKALGFNSIIFDTNTATIEKDPNGTLHQKVQAFVDYVNNPASGLRVVISDPGAGIAYALIP